MSVTSHPLSSFALTVNVGALNSISALSSKLPLVLVILVDASAVYPRFNPSLLLPLYPCMDSYPKPPPALADRLFASEYSIVTSVPDVSSEYEIPPGGSCTTLYTTPSSGTVAQNVSSLKSLLTRGFEPSGMSERIIVAVTERCKSFRSTSTRTVRR